MTFPPSPLRRQGAFAPQNRARLCLRTNVHTGRASPHLAGGKILLPLATLEMPASSRKTNSFPRWIILLSLPLWLLTPLLASAKTLIIFFIRRRSPQPDHRHSPQ